MKTYIRSLSIAMILVGCLQSPGLALNNEEVFAQFQFSFITPGARATALGGAFIGLADDATAVESNPAGLTLLTASEVSAEFKYILYTAEHAYENLSPETDVTMKEFDDAVVNVPFLSYVYPYKRFVFSAYRQEWVNYKSSFRTAGTQIRIPREGFYRIHHTDASVELTITNYGLGFALQLFENFSLAVSPRLSRMDMNSHNTRFGWSFTDFPEDDITTETLIDDSDTGFSVNAGLMWYLHPKISVGAVYRSGTTFTVTEKSGRGTPIWVLDPDNGRYDPEFTLRVPSSFGIGVAFRATDFLTFTLDEVHIRYKDLLEDFYAGVYGSSDDWGSVNEEKYFTVDNVTELHFGMEYLLTLGERLFALRAGMYTDPDHIIRYTSTGQYQVLFPGGDDQIHVTGGFGIVFSDHFQIDTAVDIAGNKKQFSISSVYRFGRKNTKTQDKKPAPTPTPMPEPVEEVLRPSITFTLVKFEKTLEIQEISPETPGVSDIHVAIKAVGKKEFIVTASLEQGEETFTTDIRIKLKGYEFSVEAMDEEGVEVKVLSKKWKSLEVMVTFDE